CYKTRLFFTHTHTHTHTHTKTQTHRHTQKHKDTDTNTQLNTHTHTHTHTQTQIEAHTQSKPSLEGRREGGQRELANPSDRALLLGPAGAVKPLSLPQA